EDVPAAPAHLQGRRRRWPRLRDGVGPRARDDDRPGSPGGRGRRAGLRRVLRLRVDARDDAAPDRGGRPRGDRVLRGRPRRHRGPAPAQAPRRDGHAQGARDAFPRGAAARPPAGRPHPERGDRARGHAVGGSWAFILLFAVALSVYTAVNVLLRSEAWDPYPFILLNLFLS